MNFFYVKLLAAQLAPLNFAQIRALDDAAQWRHVGAGAVNDKATIVSEDKLQGILVVVASPFKVENIAGFLMVITNGPASADDPTALLINLEGAKQDLRTLLVRADKIDAQFAAWVTAEGLYARIATSPPRPWRTIDELPSGLFQGNPSDHRESVERGVHRPIEHP